MANKIKNKFSAPRVTEFGTKDMVVDVKNGRLYYKSNYAVYEVRGTLFASNMLGIDFEESTMLGAANNGEVIINNNGLFDGVDDFTVTVDADTGTGIVNMGTAIATSFTSSVVDINGGTINDITSLTFSNDIDVGDVSITASNIQISDVDLDPEHAIVYTDSNGGLKTYTSGYKNIRVSEGVGGSTTPGLVARQLTSPLITYNPNTDTTIAYSLILTTGERVSGTNEGGKIILNASNTLINPGVELTGGVKIVNGDVCPGLLKADNDVVAFASDLRLKENIFNIPNPLDKIKKLRGVYFDWKEKVESLGFMPILKKNEIGMIAQEVEKVIPQAIVGAPFDENYKTIKYDRIIPLLVECINEQQKQINNLKNRLDNGI
tara:strand:+ start:1774 stop:2904 length:1131 start_codon:yes stop_codon:yes gene_type:complete